MKVFYLLLLYCLGGESFSQDKAIEDSIDKITASLDTSQFSRVAIESNIFKENNAFTTGYRTGKYTARYYADPSKELRMVVSITEYDTSSEKLVTTYFFNEKSLIKMRVVKVFGNSPSAAPNDYYYVGWMLASKEENFKLEPKRYDVQLISAGLWYRDYYYNTQRK